MTRWFAIVSCAMALALTMPVGFEAQAGHKQCKAKSFEGKSVRWRCKSGEKCCYSMLLNVKSCGKDMFCL